MRTLLAVTCCSLCFPLLALAAGPGADRPPGLKQVFSDLGLDKVKELRYEDSKGQPITGQQFQKLLAEGASLTVKKTMLPGQPVSAVLGLLAKGDKGPVSKPFAIKAGAAFPSFALTGIDGVKRSEAALRGKVTVINTYFSQCPPCVQEVPELNVLQRERPDLQFLALTFDGAAEARTFASERKFGWTALPDAKRLLADLGVMSYPSFMIVGGDGKVLAIERHDAIITRDKSISAWVKRVAPPKV